MKYLFLFLFLYPILTFSQIQEKLIGSVPIQNFAPKDYKGEPQVNCVAKDSRGVLYFGHNNGISIFDGTNWTTLTADDKAVQFIYISPNDRIIIGSEGQFGELINNEKGRFKFKVLSKEISAKNEMSTIFSINQIGDQFILSDNDYLYLFEDENKFEIIPAKGAVQEVYVINGELYVNIKQEGLFFLNKRNGLTPYEGNEILKNKKINQVLPYGKDSILIVDSEHLYVSPKRKISLRGITLPTDQMHTYSSSYALGNQDFLIGLSNAGAARLNNKFEILEIFDKENGLINNSIKSYCETQDGNIAVSTENGISIIQYHSAIRTFNSKENIHGPMEAVFGNGDKLIVVGKEGVFYLDRNEQATFKEINNLGQVGFGGGVIDSIPYVVLYDGVFMLANDSLTNVNNDIAWTVFQYDQNHYFVGGENEFVLYKKDINNSWKELLRTPLRSSVKTFFKDLNGVLWMGTYRGEGGLYRLEPEFNNNSNFDSGILTYFDQKDLGIDGDVCVFGNENQALFGSRTGVLFYNELTNTFEYSKDFEALKNKPVNLAAYDNRGNLWGFEIKNNEDRALVYIDTNSNSHREGFNIVNENLIYGIYASSYNDVWLAGAGGLFLFSHSEDNKFSPFHTFFKGISIGDSLVHLGNFKTNTGFSFEQLDPNQFIFPYSKTAINFTFGATNFTDVKNTVFSYYLEGFDQSWSEWTKDNNVKYTNLPEGKYILKVKSLNSSGVSGIPTEIKFEILAPWYRTWSFYAIVLVLGITIIYLLFRHRTATLRKRQVVLEQTIKDRTAEVIVQKQEAELQRDLAQKEHQIAEEQKHLVEEKNKEISDSINYAERIQFSMLANEELVQQYLKDYFIFFQPKDVVSGDFYWASELKNGKLALVNADSTGHGVPGAIMSMLNMNSLKEAVSGKELTQPHEILNYTRSIIKETLENDGSAEGGKDGMDCSLMVFDLEHNKIQFAAAGNPVWIVRNNELIEFKGDKMPVGKHDRDYESFTTQEFEVQKGDIIYTLTDGMPDQFGGPKGKKFMYKKLKNLLVEISTLPLATQHSTLRTEMGAWMGDEEQVDDVCIIGVRV
jgi:serine phosphatase RsbU (regulator of sigma subunit)/ligand-binding sensor domain-containing protein